MGLLPRRLAGTLLVAFTAGCSANPAEGGAPRPARDVITQAEMRERGFRTAYEAVEALRSTWLRPRGPDSLRTPAEVVVYFDSTRMGGVETLRTLDTQTVAYIRYYDAVAATSRWGVGHGQGVIFVSSVAP